MDLPHAVRLHVILAIAALGALPACSGEPNDPGRDAGAVDGITSRGDGDLGDGAAVELDARPGVDAHAPDTGTNSPDAGDNDAIEPLPDAGMTENDAGSAPNDAGSAPNDAGSAPNDAGSAPNDAGSAPNDGGSTLNDAGSVPNDGGSTLNDGGSAPNDAGSGPIDSGPEPGLDAATINDAATPVQDVIVPIFDAYRPPVDVTSPGIDVAMPVDDVATPPDDAGDLPDQGTATGNNPVRAENDLPGTDAWQLSHNAGEHQVEGYASATSVAPGESFRLMVNVDATHGVHWEAYRLGWYQGHGGRLVARGNNVTVSPQPDCPMDSDTGMIECHWAPAFTITPDAGWVTGQYLIKLVRDDGYDLYVPIVVRETSPRAPLLFQASVNTWAAYNAWGGTSLYKNTRGGAFTAAHAFKVSFDRPYDPNDSGAGELRRYEMWMVRWLEQKGYDVAYVTNVDLDAHPDWALGRRMLLSVGHDEYWTGGLFDTFEQARDGGVNLGFFSANTAYWQVRYENSSTGAPRRVVVGYKEYVGQDPLRGTALATGRFRDPPTNRPENALLGIMYELWSNTDAYPMVVTDPSHWVFQGTGVRAGDTLANVVGYEWDHAWDNGAQPSSLELVTTSWGVSHDGINAPSHVSVYYPRPDSFVFAAGSIEWSYGLSRPGFVDARVQRMTENILARAGVLPQAYTEPDPAGPPSDPGSARGVAVVAGGAGQGYLDGPTNIARFDSPAGVAVAPDGTVFVTDTRNHRVRMVGPDGTVTTLAGCGPTGASRSNTFRDGTGSSACFDVPTGIAVGPDGRVYVSDTWNHRIRAITRAGVVTTFAGTGDEGGHDSSNALNASFAYPRGLAFGPDGSLYVADSGNGAVRRIRNGAVTTVAAGFYEPVGVAVAADGSLYVADSALGTVSGVVAGGPAVLAGLPWELGDAEGDGASARLRPGDGLAAGDGVVYVSDMGNYRVRAVSLAGAHAVSTLLGDGRYGAGSGTGATTHVVLPRGLAAVPGGFLLADSGNHRVLRITP